MKTFVLIEASYDVWEKLNVDVRQKLIQVYPAGHRSGSRNFYSYLPASDPRVTQLFQILTEAGLKPWRELDSKRPDEFTYAKVRKYDEAELDHFQLLRPMGRPTNLDSYIWPAKDGTLQVKSRYFKVKRLIDDGNIHSLLVSKELREALEAEGFRGMIFRAVRPQEEGASVPFDNLWELTTDCRLPPLSDYCTLINREGKPVEGAPDVACQYFEDFWMPQELHYLAGALKEWSWPDFALTHELFWFSEKRHRHLLITTQRFYQFCKVRKVKMDWIPVRIDPD